MTPPDCLCSIVCLDVLVPEPSSESPASPHPALRPALLVRDSCMTPPHCSCSAVCLDVLVPEPSSESPVSPYAALCPALLVRDSNMTPPARGPFHAQQSVWMFW